MRILAIQDEVSKLKKGEAYVVKKTTAEEVFAVLDELKNDDTVVNDNTVLSDTTDADAQPNQEVVSETTDTTDTTNDAEESLPVETDTTEDNTNVQSQPESQHEAVELTIEGLTIDDIPDTDFECTQEDDQEQAS